MPKYIRTELAAIRFFHKRLGSKNKLPILNAFLTFYHDSATLSYRELFVLCALIIPKQMF